MPISIDYFRSITVIKTAINSFHTDEYIISRIYIVRGQKVMLDRDLAALYGVETKRLKEAVKRNMTRFPDDFMFEMTTEELADWRTQFATSNSELKGLRHTPYCFTEQGVTMLSCILNSSRAIQVNIRIIRTFVKMRDLFAINADLQLQLQQLERKVDANDTEIRTLLDLIHHYLSLHEQPRNPIGFKYGL